MVSLSYPNVNKHIFATEPASSLAVMSYVNKDYDKNISHSKSTGLECTTSWVEPKQRMSAPPPYSKEDPVAEKQRSSKAKVSGEVIEFISILIF